MRVSGVLQGRLQTIDQAMVVLDRWAKQSDQGAPAAWRQGARIWREMLLMSRDGSAGGVAPSIRKADLDFALKIALDKRSWTRFERFYATQMFDPLSAMSQDSGLPVISATRLTQKRGGNPDSTEAVCFLIFQLPGEKVISVAPAATTTLDVRQDQAGQFGRQTALPFLEALAVNVAKVRNPEAGAQTPPGTSTAAGPNNCGDHTDSKPGDQSVRAGGDVKNAVTKSASLQDLREELLLLLLARRCTEASAGTHLIAVYAACFIVATALLVGATHGTTEFGFATEATRVLVAIRDIVSGYWYVFL